MLLPDIYAESGVTAHNIFGTSEISGPMFTDCSELNGMHICGDIAYTEIIDPKTGDHGPEKGSDPDDQVTNPREAALKIVEAGIELLPAKDYNF